MRALMTAALALAVVGAAAPPAGPLPDKDVYLRGLAGMVDVFVVRGGDVAFGTGALVSDTLVVTCAHLVEVDAKGRPTGLIVVGASSDEPAGATAHGGAATLVRRDAASDLALLRLEHPLAGKRPLALGPAPEVGDAVFYFGNPDEAPTTFGRGVETRLHYPGPKKRWCQFTGFVWPGMSGGPLLDDRGRLVGIVAAMNVVDDPFRDGEKVAVPNIGYHAPRADVAKILAEALP